MDTQTITPSRAHGRLGISWPEAFGAEPETCCVALRVQVTQDRVGDDVEILHDLPRLAVGEPEQTLRELIEYRLSGAGRQVLLAELDAVGPIDPHRPLVLERLHVDNGLAVYLEALILPVAREQLEELDELLGGEPDPSTRHGLGWLYAEDLADLWCAASPDGRLPVRYLEDALQESDRVKRPEQLPPPLAQAAMLAGV
jgi:hypothetical protein